MWRRTSWRVPTVGLSVALLGSFIGPTLAFGQDDLAARGQIIADTYCSACHATGATDDSPVAEAPPMRTFETMWPVENLAEALAEGIMVGHRGMPEIAMTPSEIDAFLAYLESF